MRIYIDTSVIGGCFDPGFAESSRKLIDEFKKGRKIAIISDRTLRELEMAPMQVKRLIETIPSDFLTMIVLDEEAKTLALRYIHDGAISRKHIVDAQHIGMATVHHVDVLASWNFKEMVNVYKIRQYNAVNLKYGYPMIDIRTPEELIYES